MKHLARWGVPVLLAANAALAQTSVPAQVTPPDPKTPDNQITVNRSRGNSFNPDLSANLLGFFQLGSTLTDNRNSKPHRGFNFQEAEIQATSSVDPYSRAVVVLSIEQNDVTGKLELGPEEVYFETTSIPSVTLRGGKFRTIFGKHNAFHTHVFPFVDAPLIQSRILGEDGINEMGLSAAALLPMPWFSELTIQGLTGANEALFNSSQSGDLVAIGRFKNLWDLNDDLTAEFGLSGGSGRNAYDDRSNVYGMDLTFKWRPSIGGKARSVAWTTEYIGARRGSTTLDVNATIGGAATWLQVQFSERWWTQVRVEGEGHLRRQSALLGFFPSEFSGFRAQYDRREEVEVADPAPIDHRFALQYNISIGAHPAHAY